MDLDLVRSHVQLNFNSKLPSEVLRRLKERKVKLRKFMLYVNSVLNDTEEEMQQICQAYGELGDFLFSHGISPKVDDEDSTIRFPKKKRVSFSASSTHNSSRDVTERREDVLVPETAPQTIPVSPDYPDTPTVNETNMEDTRLFSPEADICKEEESFFLPGQSETEMKVQNKKVGVETHLEKISPRPAAGFETDKADPEEFCKPRIPPIRHKIHHTKCRKPEATSVRASSIEHDDEAERLESTFLSPVSSLVNSVLGSKNESVNNKGVEIPDNKPVKTLSKSDKALDNPTGGISTGCEQQINPDSSKEPPAVETPIRTKAIMSLDNHTPIPTGKPTNVPKPVDLTASPALFDDDDFQEELMDEGDTGDSDDDITQLPNSTSLDMTDIVVTKEAKKPAKWPIGYTKPASKGELVVEPSSGKKSNKRVRQTRLDGFLAKTSNRPSSQAKRSIISLKSSSHHQHTNTGPKMSANRTQTAVKLDQTHKNRDVEDSIHSDSDDALDEMDLELLDTEIVRKSEGRIHSGSINQSANNQTCDATASTSGTRRQRDHSEPNESIPQKKQKLLVGDVVRGRARKDLTGFRCMQCYEYYKSLRMSEDEIQLRLDEVCRHRAVKPPMQTPPGFWNMSIASTLDHNESSL